MCPGRPGVPVPQAMIEAPGFYPSSISVQHRRQHGRSAKRRAALQEPTARRAAAIASSDGALMDVRTLHFTSAELHFATAKRVMYISRVRRVHGAYAVN